MRGTKTVWVMVLMLVLAAGSGAAKAAPQLLNFQGVLRDAAGAPLDGSFDLRFEFVATSSCVPLESNLLMDTHLAEAVTGGLFSVTLGGGALAAGAESSLADVFRNHAPVYVHVSVRPASGEALWELLCPPLEVHSAAYALDADSLDGKDSSELLDTSATTQVKTGDLTVQDLTLDSLQLAAGGSVYSNAGQTVMVGDADADQLVLFPGNTADDGYIVLNGGSTVQVAAGNGQFSFYDAGAGFPEIARLSTAGLQFPDGTVQPTAAVPADGPCSDDVNRFVDCGNGTVTDTVTGLLWLQSGSCVASTTYSAANSAAATVSDGQCGLTDHSSPGDWRLPTHDEWWAITTQGNTNGCTNPAVPDTEGTGCCATGPCSLPLIADRYWSSSTVDAAPSYAYAAGFGGISASVSPFDKTSSRRVALVRTP